MKNKIEEGRPPNATIEGLRKCIKWLDACRELGWEEEQMPALESLFWKHRDKHGDLKT